MALAYDIFSTPKYFIPALIDLKSSRIYVLNKGVFAYQINDTADFGLADLERINRAQGFDVSHIIHAKL